MNMFFTVDFPNAETFLYLTNLEAENDLRYLSIPVFCEPNISCGEIDRAVASEIEAVFSDVDDIAAIEALRQRVIDECAA